MDETASAVGAAGTVTADRGGEPGPRPQGQTGKAMQVMQVTTTMPERRSARNAARIPPVAQLRLGWQERAACQGSDAKLFFGPEKERIREREAREGAAKRVCASCPVLRDCRNHALQTPELFGIWGGLSETDREIGFGRSFGRRIPRPRSVAA
ncbi:MAG: WhiB family transcriptional regulator [Actinocrinis sp.]